MQLAGLPISFFYDDIFKMKIIFESKAVLYNNNTIIIIH